MLVLCVGLKEGWEEEETEKDLAGEGGWGGTVDK